MRPLRRVLLAAWRGPLRLRERALGRLFGTLVSVDTARPLVALTFDDGPDPVTTPLVLDVLARHRAHATFFMVGRAALRHPALVARVAAAGHTIGHHTLDHRSLLGLDAETLRAQIRGGFEAVGPACARLFRPPFGHLDLAAWRGAHAAGHEVVAWSGHVDDWTAQDAATLAARLRERLAPGAIVLLHDAPQRGDHDAAPRAALVEALDQVLGEPPHGLRFVTLPELLAAGRPRRRVRWRSHAVPGAPADAQAP